MTKWLAIVLLLCSHYGKAAPLIESESAKAGQIDEVIAACAQARKKDEVCDAIVKLKDIGNDALEAIKEFTNLTPAQYFALTVANAMAQGRIRIRTRPKWAPHYEQTIDIKNKSITILISTQF
ncbi:MAG: hypothetical protein LW875_02865 [Proteobacteria bacterium]|jgi:hypothetical protein|nr:hypothetical protein [Pseudomonadota bacterium]